MNKISNSVSKIALRMFIIDILKCIFVGIASCFVLNYFIQNKWLSILGATFGFVALGFYLNIWKNKKEAAKKFVHQHNPKLEHSLSLLEKKELNVVEIMQVDRIMDTKIQLPMKLDKAFWILFFAAILSYAFSFIPKKLKNLNLPIANLLETAVNSSEEKQPKFNYSVL